MGAKGPAVPGCPELGGAADQRRASMTKVTSSGKVFAKVRGFGFAALGDVVAHLKTESLIFLFLNECVNG